jgi:hypothetical protein
MLKKRKIDIKVYNDKSIIRLMIFFLIIFIVLVTSNINLYIINKNKIGIAFIVSVALIILFGAITLFFYYIVSEKMYVIQDKMISKIWFGFKRKFTVDEIDKVIFEKGYEDGKSKIITIEIFVKTFHRKYIESQNDFDKLVNYLIANVDKEKIVYYMTGTEEDNSL